MRTSSNSAKSVSSILSVRFANHNHGVVSRLSICDHTDCFGTVSALPPLCHRHVSPHCTFFLALLISTVANAKSRIRYIIRPASWSPHPSTPPQRDVHHGPAGRTHEFPWMVATPLAAGDGSGGEALRPHGIILCQVRTSGGAAGTHTRPRAGGGLSCQSDARPRVQDQLIKHQHMTRHSTNRVRSPSIHTLAGPPRVQRRRSRARLAPAATRPTRGAGPGRASNNIPASGARTTPRDASCLLADGLVVRRRRCLASAA